MALATYSDLLSAVSGSNNWNARTDIAGRVPDFVALAEAQFNRELRMAQMIVVNTVFPFAGEFVPLPTGFLEARDFYLNVNPRTSLVFLSPDSQTDYFSASGQPRFYSIVGQNFRFGPAPNGNYTGTLIYFQSIPGLQANTQNWLMTAHPNLYLFNTNMQAALYLKDAESAQYWNGLYQTELQAVKDADKRMKYSGTGMAVRVAGCVV